MALNIPGLKFLSDTNTRTRLFLIVAAVIGVAILIYAISRLLSGNAPTTGATRVAGAPSGLQSVPGGQLSPEYYRALMQANEQAAQQAQMTGGSAVPTLVNIPGQQQVAGSQSCTILCPGEENANVVDDINELVRSGKLSQTDANRLLELAKNEVPVDQYAAALDELVRQGKLTPEQARKLLDDYKKQHAHALLTASANTMDAMIKSGQLPLDVANDLLALQKKKVSPAEYAAELARLVKEGKISPEVAAKLLADYTQQQAKEAAKEGLFQLQQMTKAGQVTPDVAKQLAELQSKNVPIDQYAAELNKLVAEGKLTPAAAAKLLEDYKKQRTGFSVAGPISELMAKGGPAAAEAKHLLDMQANNASLGDYANELKRAVQAGIITPEMASALMQQYQALTAASITPGGGAIPTTETSLPGTEDFAKLQQRVQQQPQVAPSTGGATDQFAAARAQAEALALQDKQQRVEQLMSSMSAQAQSLLTAWQPPVMKHAGITATTKAKLPSVGGGGQAGSGAGGKSTSPLVPSKPPLIKAGSILFAVLETAVDSDYPDTPVMATIVQGKFKGAKLLGKLNLAQGQDRVSLHFNLMDEDQWPQTKTIDAFAIDPDTARTVLASNVDHHYLMRYGSMFASSFLSGYASAIQSSGSSSTSIFGQTTTVHPELSPNQKIAVGLGQVGTAFSNAVGSYVNTPATVKVNSGAGLGILFVGNVTE